MIERRPALSSRVVYYASPLLEAIGVAHCFSTRLGGVSEAPFDSLNLGNPSGVAPQDSREHIRENERRLLAAAGFGTVDAICKVHQVHGNAVVHVAQGVAHDPHAQADAITSDDPSRAVSVRVADCVPILLATRDGSIVSAVHAGWRGVVSGVLAAAAGGIRERHAQSLALVAAIGPSIGPDAFEVGPEVKDAFEQAFAPAACETFLRTGKPGKFHVDLRAALRVQLLALGVAPECIDSTDRCTHRDAEEFFSHRRDHGVTGRLAAFIRAKAR